MIECRCVVERWALIEPFEIARETMTHVPLLVVTLSDGRGCAGRGEAAGVDYDGETPRSMAAQIDGVRAALTDDVDGDVLRQLLPKGGARNALDCALWDLRAKQTGVPVPQRLGATWHPLTTALTFGLGDVATLTRCAVNARGCPVVKLKVDAERHLERVRVVRTILPEALILVDPNQSWSARLLDALEPELVALGVALIEQPLPRDADRALAHRDGRIPVAADESCSDRASLPGLADRYDAINIKLDKCGGLTEALDMVDEARRLGLALMVGNMCGSSLAMAPAFVIGQRCRFVDLDGPLLQKADRPHAMRYADGRVDPPSPRLWG